MSLDQCICGACPGCLDAMTRHEESVIRAESVKGVPEKDCPHHTLSRKSKPFQDTRLGTAFLFEWWECGDCGKHMGVIPSSRPWTSMGGCQSP